MIYDDYQTHCPDGTEHRMFKDFFVEVCPAGEKTLVCTEDGVESSDAEVFYDRDMTCTKCGFSAWVRLTASEYAQYQKGIMPDTLSIHPKGKARKVVGGAVREAEPVAEPELEPVVEPVPEKKTRKPRSKNKKAAPVLPKAEPTIVPVVKPVKEVKEIKVVKPVSVPPKIKTPEVKKKRMKIKIKSMQGVHTKA